MTFPATSLSSSQLLKNKIFSAEIFEGGVGLENQVFEDLRFYQCELKGELKTFSFKGSSFPRLSFDVSSAHRTNFESCRIENSSGSRYFFEECRFSKSVFRQSDFSGGALLGADFTEAVFENTDFALCEFSNCRFDRARFLNCNFNASLFENTSFQEAVFENTTFKYVEGLTKEQEDSMRRQGAVLCPPFEIQVRESLEKFFWIRRSPWLRHGLVALLFFLLGFYSPRILSFAKQMILLEANPLLTPIQALQSLPEASFFKGRLALTNFDFSQDLDGWIPDPLRAWDKTGLQVQYDTFQSFPSALRTSGFQGRLFYSQAKNATLSKDPLQTQPLWLPVDPRGEKLKLSFYCKNGHPQFRVYGKFKDGGSTLLTEIGARTVAKDPPWVYFSEGVSVPPTMKAVCLELSRFPQEEIFLDDVNLEATF